MVTVNCQICDSSELEPLYSIHEEGAGYLMSLCRSCKHLQVAGTERTQEQEQGTYYAALHDNDDELWKKVDAGWGTRRVRAFENILLGLKKLGFGGGRMLDIGSGFGYMLNMARKRGFEVLGVEPSPLARRLAGQRLGVESVPDVDAIPAERSSFDVILCLETLYYCRDVREMLLKIRGKLSPAGCFVLKIRANRTALFRLAAAVSRLRGKFMSLAPGDLLYHYNLRGYHLFTTRNAQRLLKNTGFHIVKTVNEKGAPVRITSMSGVLKMLRTTVSICVNAITLGKVKIGTEITIYATPKAASDEAIAAAGNA